ncbi:hypothetical protein [uncultured Acetobacteroides sp.]|uniref:hypothetical protein n=1 Tax=uncultured Acetobacteroides sp. TaxID=1760811 RepID=UPI0029F57E7F|nr:hypothetical protein [uncultured Acetobacteroides sp.]
MKKILTLVAMVALAGSVFAQTPAVKTEKVKAPVEKKECCKKAKAPKASKGVKPAKEKATAPAKK